MELYRISAVGVALTEALNTMLEAGELPIEEAVRILENFDQNFEETLRENILLQKDVIINEAQGTIASYNSIQDAWKVDIESFHLKLGGYVRKYSRARLLFQK